MIKDHESENAYELVLPWAPIIEHVLCAGNVAGRQDQVQGQHDQESPREREDGEDEIDGIGEGRAVGLLVARARLGLPVLAHVVKQRCPKIIQGRGAQKGRRTQSLAFASPDERRMGGIDRDVGQARRWNMESAVERARRHWGRPIILRAFPCARAQKEEWEKENE